MLLAAVALALSLTFAGNTPAAPPANPTPQASFSQVPATQPGLSHFEGVFLVTTADDGNRAVYFIASNSRHSILWTDMQIELQLNPLWPVFSATPDQVLDYPEGAAIGGAHTALVGGAPADPQPAAQAAIPDSQPAAASDAQDDGALPSTYVLRRGDNLTRIAAEFGTSVDNILAANGLPNANRIYAGQILVIPTESDLATATDVQADVPVASAPDDDLATAAASTDDAPADATAYTVQRGDSAFKIARRFGIDEAALLAANAISNPNRVYIGQVLTIPASSW